MEKFSQMPYRRPDLAAAKALIETTAEKIRSAQTAKSALEAMPHTAKRAPILKPCIPLQASATP